MGDLNEGPPAAATQAVSLTPLFDNNSHLVDCYSLQNFQLGNRHGTFDSCGLRNRLDYVLISNSLVPLVTGGEIFRKGLWGTRKTRPTEWATYSDMIDSSEQASDHAAVFIDLNI
jgi:endonuclease/exonuclease/phosphatase family metal-dependent hydrolase